MSNQIWMEDQIELKPSKITSYDHDMFGPVTVFHDIPIAREIVHKYDDGMAYKPAKELEETYWTAEGRWARAGGHPATALIFSKEDINGRTVDARFTKGLKDLKTRRPNNRGILANLEVFDNKVPPDTLDDMKNGKRRDVSIGFSFEKDDTAGVIEEDGHPLNGESYDYVQRNIMIDHIAFGLESGTGRCPTPACGLGADQIFTALDPFAGYESFSECIEDIMKKNPKYTKEQAAGTCAEIEKRSKAKKDFKSEGEGKLSMSKLTEVKLQLNEVLSQLDDLVEETFQGNEGARTEAERAKAHFNISNEEWEALTDEEKQGYIDKLPPRGSGESDVDCTYEWETVKEALFKSDKWRPITLSPILGEMTFDDEKVTISAETLEKLKELDVELEPCKSDEDDDEVGEDEKDDYDEIMAPHLVEDAVLSYAAKKALPDSAYAYIESGCKKEDGKTQQSCRHMPIHDESHVRAALAALKGARTGKVPSYASKAKPKVCAAAKKFGIKSEVCGTKGDLDIADIDTDELIKKFDKTLKDKDLFAP